LGELEVAVSALQQRVEVLRHKAIIETKKTVLTVETDVKAVKQTGNKVDKRSRQTLREVRRVSEGTQSINRSLEEASRQNSLDMKTMDGKLDNIHHSQQETHEHVKNMSGVEYAKYKADEAFRIATRAAQCENILVAKLVVSSADSCYRDRYRNGDHEAHEEAVPSIPRR
jgi:hypothetical protein